MDRRQFLKLIPATAGALVLPEQGEISFETSSGQEWEKLGREMMDGVIAGLRPSRFSKIAIDGEGYYIPLYSKEQIDE
jgi:hypothetical protein